MPDSDYPDLPTLVEALRVGPPGIGPMACPFCGEREWVYLHDIGSFAGGIRHEGGDADGSDEDLQPPPLLTGYPAIVFNCLKCGYVRTHLHPLEDD